MALPCLAAVSLLGACAARPPLAAAKPQPGPPPRWTQDNLIEPDQLLPNGLRPLRYFYW